MIQSELISLISERPAQFAWFLGAGASRTAGLPTAGDIIWDMKRRYYIREENREVSPQDVQNDAVRSTIQSFMDSRGFPALWSDEEYSTYFWKIFGADHERQRRYLRGILSEEKVTLSIGNRVLGGLLTAGMCRAVFTTNFDSVVERAVAEVGGGSLQAYSLEGTGSAANAFLNEEYPFYCKLHGDFRFESLKNLSADLATQNDELSKAFVASGTRFGLVVCGYSGRDASVMELMSDVLSAPNPFPQGLYWTGMKGSPVHPAVAALLERAVSAGVKASYVEIETFDAFMSRLWRSIDGKPAAVDAKVRKAQLTSVQIPLPSVGGAKPLIRLNGLPVQLPTRCLELTFKVPQEWADLRDAVREWRQSIVVTKGASVWCWGARRDIEECFGDKLSGLSETALPADYQAPENLHFKPFIEEALILALTRGRPLLPRMKPSSGFIIADPYAEDVGSLSPLQQIVGKTSGTISGLFSPVTEFRLEPDKVRWAESLRVSLDRKEGRDWLLLEPDIWIWPPHARAVATNFLDERKAKRFNGKHNELLQAWTNIILDSDRRNADLAFRPFENGDDAENPTFKVSTRTAFSRRLTA
ncbi:SIR2 family protein [Rhizobium wenxiniae]|uniref:SIR2 family protein n=1 Tax=Rhizobium wenxiniae TaxID=1737357 RepID=UPI001C6E6BC1|nr:SIR2 family protein [Rhizobium wenxiniae]MBW9088152.1 SIR2 family protein [Rhizobium wenxiniae]